MARYAQHSGENCTYLPIHGYAQLLQTLSKITEGKVGYSYLDLDLLSFLSQAISVISAISVPSNFPVDRLNHCARFCISIEFWAGAGALTSPIYTYSGKLAGSDYYPKLFSFFTFIKEIIQN
uniref:Uncharacterized protein n=1 Tax=Cacopsylla melanoneura TaxID=428564 RepID=A0A8D8YZY9_9HEMI